MPQQRGGSTTRSTASTGLQRPSRASSSRPRVCSRAGEPERPRRTTALPVVLLWSILEPAVSAATIRVLVSACLLGERVRYDGRDARCASDVLDRWAREGRLVPFCPEVAGGFPVPRPAAEIHGGDGRSVLTGLARVRDVAGRDVTSLFEQGARRALETARSQGVRLAIL